MITYNLTKRPDIKEFYEKGVPAVETVYLGTRGIDLRNTYEDLLSKSIIDPVNVYLSRSSAIAFLQGLPFYKSNWEYLSKKALYLYRRTGLNYYLELFLGIYGAGEYLMITQKMEQCTV